MKKEFGLSQSGLSMISVVVGTVLGGLAIFAGIQVLSLFQGAANKRTTTAGAVSQTSTIATYLKANFEGTKSFQNLSLRIPVGAGNYLASRGAGFIVEKDGAVDGTEMPSECSGRFHRITFAIKEAAPTELKLGAPLSTGTLNIIPATPIPHPTTVFPQSQLLVVSNNSMSEALLLTSALGLPTGGQTMSPELKLTVTDEVRKFLPGAQLQGEYLAGDPVYKLKLVRLGVELTDNRNCLGTLKAVTVVPSYNGFTILASAPISIGLNRFNAEPILDSYTANCPLIDKTQQTAVDFSMLNADTTGNCYSVVKQLKLKYSLVYHASEGRGLASQLEANDKTREESSEYYFTTNR